MDKVHLRNLERLPPNERQEYIMRVQFQKNKQKAEKKKKKHLSLSLKPEEDKRSVRSRSCNNLSENEQVLSPKSAKLQRNISDCSSRVPAPTFLRQLSSRIVRSKSDPNSALEQTLDSTLKSLLQQPGT